MSENPWAKIWWDWYASRSHIGLSGVALALGAPLMLLCRENGFLSTRCGHPIDVTVLARVTRFQESVVALAFAELIEVGSIREDATGALRLDARWKPSRAPAAMRRGPLPRLQVLDRDAWTCTYCGADLREQTPHIDHVIPFSRGGSDEPSNLAASCGTCNRRKGNRTPEEWVQ